MSYVTAYFKTAHV